MQSHNSKTLPWNPDQIFSIQTPESEGEQLGYFSGAYLIVFIYLIVQQKQTKCVVNDWENYIRANHNRADERANAFK